MLNLKNKQIAVIALFIILLATASGGYVLGVGISSDYTSILFLSLIAVLFIMSVMIYLLMQIPQSIKNILLSLLIVASYIIMLDYIENTFKFNANSSIYLVFSLITMIFGLTEGLTSVIYGAVLFFLKAYTYSRPFERYIFYIMVSFFAVITIGLIMAYEKKILQRLRNKISTLQEAPIEFSIKPGSGNESIQYSEIISDDGLKKEKNRLMTMLNERLYGIVETIRSTIHPFTVILYLMDNNMNLKGREILSNSEWIDMDRPLKADDTYIGWILKNKKSLLLNEIKDEIKDIPYYTRNEGIKSFMAVPALKDNDIIGVICVDSLEVQAFTDEHVKLLSVITNQIIDLLDNIELQYKLRYDMHEKGAMYTFVRTLSHFINASEIGETALREIIRITGANAGIFAIKNESRTFDVVTTYNINRDLSGKSFFLDTAPIHDGILESQFSSANQVSTSQIKLLYPALHNLYEPDKALKYTAIISLRGKTEEVGMVVLFMDNTLNKRISIILDTLINQVSISLYNSILFNKLGKLATTDGLTGLHNHRHFQEYIDVEVKEALRYRKPLTLFMIDIDHFKILNDTYGHPKGDRVLKKLSDVIMQSMRDVDYAARYGGEEFSIVLPSTDVKGAYKIAERLRKKVEAVSIDNGSSAIKFTISIGISGIPEDAGNKQDLISHADEALYLSKENGRNQTTIYGNIRSKE